MTIHLERTVTANFTEAISREWLETNGIGGWASSTITNAHTRRYHGLLVAATRPPVGRVVLLSKLDETLVREDARIELGTNVYPGSIHPQGYRYLRGFSQDFFPSFTYEVNGIVIQKTVAAIHGENTTVIVYQVIDAPGLFDLELCPFVSGRDTMIALPGLTLVTGRYEDAKKILQAFAENIDQGMLPNRFPDAGETPEYNTVDASLWFFVAAYKYYLYTQDQSFLEEILLPAMAEILDWHQRGTRARQVLETVEEHLLTPLGLRSLSPQDPAFKAIYQGDAYQRDAAYHQGTVWAWLLGPYLTALVRVRGKTGRKQGLKLVQAVQGHLSESGIGQVSEIFDGDAPHTPRGCIAQAWSVAEILRAYIEDLQNLKR